MNSWVVATQVATLFIVIIIGFIARKTNIITEDMTGKLSNFLLLITQPMLIISSFDFEFSQDIMINALLVLAMSVLIHVLAILVGMIVYKKYPARVRSVLKFFTVFSNCGYMGFPVLDSLFGSIGVFYGALYVIPFNVFSMSYGILVFTGKSDKDTIKKILTHPAIISVGIGMVMFLLNIKLPEAIANAVSMVGSMTSPLSMLIVGALLAGIPFRKMFKGSEVYIGSAVRLILMPLMVYGILKLFNLPEIVFRVSVTLSAMPAAASTAIFAERYGGDSELGSRCVSISTIFSIITIPLIVMLLK